VTGHRVPNARLREAIESAGLTYDALARAVQRVAAEHGETLATNKSAVAHWVAGARPSGRAGHYVAEALSRRLGRPVTTVEIDLPGCVYGLPCTEDPVADLAELGRADLERRSFVTAATFSTAGMAAVLSYDDHATARMLRARRPGAAAGPHEVELLRQFTAAFRAADERLGGGHGLSTVTAHLADTAVPLLRARFPSQAVRREAFGAVAELAYLAGWKHHDLGHEGAAQRYYAIGFQLACEADPFGHAAWMMRALAHQALDLGRPQQCLEMAEGALRRANGWVDGRTEALLHVTRARAGAAMGDRHVVTASLLAAEEAVTRDDGPQPSYSAVLGPAAVAVANHTAKSLRQLSDHRSTEKHYRAALATVTPGRERLQSLTHADLGSCLAAQARADEAVSAWSSALDLMDGIASGRTRKAVATMRPTLAVYARRGVPGAADLSARTREALA
jgi:hypothetical protein